MTATCVQRLSLLREIKPAYERLRVLEAQLNRDEPNPFPDLELVALAVRPGPTWPAAQGNAAALKAAIKECGGGGSGFEGWVRLRSGTQRFETQADFAANLDDSLGPPLWGEWSVSKTTGLHLRPDSLDPRQMRLWAYVERSLGDSDGLRDDEIPALRQQTHLLAAPLPDPGMRQGVSLTVRTLHYHVYWGAASEDDPSALRRLLAVFAGFGLHRWAEQSLHPKGSPKGGR